MTKNTSSPAQRQLDSLKAKAKPYQVSIKTIRGLYVTVSPLGTISFKYDRGKPHKGNLRYFNLGRYPDISLLRARELLEGLQQKHRDKSLKVSTIRTVDDLCDSYMKTKNQLKRPDVILQLLNHDIKPVIGSKLITSVTQDHCENLVQDIYAKGAEAHATKVLRYLKALFSHARYKKLIQDDPTTEITPKLAGIIYVTPKKKMLSNKDIHHFWNTIAGGKRAVNTTTCAKVLLLLGCRTGELRLAEWEHLNLRKKTLTIPVKNQKITRVELRKTAVDFVIPLPLLALELIQNMQGYDGVYIFGTGEGKPFYEKALGLMFRRMNYGFTPHDLRRTFRTILTNKLKVELPIAERCINHSLGRMVETYDVAVYLKQRRKAVNKLAKYISKVVGNE